MNAQLTLVLLLGTFLLLLLVMLRSLLFRSTDLTRYELERRIKIGDLEAVKTAQRESALPDVLALRYVVDALLVVLVVVCLVDALGWLFGVLASMLVLLFANTLARWTLVRVQAQKLYDKYEAYVIKVTLKLQPGLRLVRQVSDQQKVDFTLHSKEELVHIIDEAKSVLTQEERHLLTHSIQFETKLVSEIMTPRSVVEVIDQKETLGPIVLDRLHKTGHSRFPVVDKDIDKVVGLLYSHDLIKHAQSNKKVLAEKAMESRVFYINENQSLQSALAGFLRVKHHLFIVVNEFEEATGIITIEDVLETLIGRKIVDEFDQYDDLRVVAKRGAAKRKKEIVHTYIS